MHDRRFARTDWKCKCGAARELEEHLSSGLCSIYGGIRRKYGDLKDEATLVEFFQEVLARREEMEEEETMAAAPTSQSPSRGTSKLGVERPASC